MGVSLSLPPRSASDSRYLPGKRTRDWLKIKTHSEQEFVVAGYTKGTGRRASSFGSLVLGYYVGGCRSLGYKATFRPNQLLHADGVWRDHLRE